MESLLAFVSGFVAAALVAIVARRLGAFDAAATADGTSPPDRPDKHRHLQSIVAAMPDTLMRVDASHRIVELKMASGQGEPSPLVKVTRPLEAMFGEHVATVLAAAVDRAGGSGEILEFEMRVRRDLRHFEARITRLDTGDALVVLRDVTEQKVTRAALERAREVAEAETRARADFLARMSHDLRNPMTGVIGMTDILLHEEVDPRRRRRLEIIQRTGGYFVSIVNDILAFSRAEQGKLVLATEHAELDVIAADVLELAIGEADPKGLELFLDVGEGVASRYEIDQLRMQQVIGNLIGNAVRFTDRGHVAVRIARVGELVEICVEDTGVGIPESAKATVFDPFVQGEAEGPRKSGGAGLGLAVAKQLVTLMDGTIEVDSALGRGSVFRVRLPLRPVPESEPLVAVTRDPIVVAVASDLGRQAVEAALARVAAPYERVSDLAALGARLATARATVLIDTELAREDPELAARLLAQGRGAVVWVASALADGSPAWCPDGHRTLQHPLRRASLLACLAGEDAGR